MTGTRPRIGLTTYDTEAAWGVWRTRAALVPGSYVAAVADAGGTPLLLPPSGSDPGVLDLLDGLIVIGGADVDPGSYGAAAHPTSVADPKRDRHELGLVRAALDGGTPLLAICRGIQVLNVALGGTLHQHLPDLLGHDDYRPGAGRFGAVTFRTEPGSRIAAALGERGTAPCYHHQGIDRVAAGLRVTARSDDGLVQAVEPDGPGWVLGVQFHPEENREQPQLFAALLAAAREHARRHRREAVRGGSR